MPSEAGARSLPQGVLVRLSGLSREGLDDGSTRRLVDRLPVTGIATDGASFAAAVATGSAYEEQLCEFAEQDVAVEDAVLWAMTDDARRGCDLLVPLYESSAGRDGRLSIAADPRCAYDTEGTLHEARRIHTVVGRENLYVGVPATAEGVPALQQLVSEGISVDATAVHGLEQVRQVIAAHLAGLEQAAARGRDLSRIAASLSVSVADLDSEVARLSTGLGARDLGASERIARGSTAAAMAEQAACVLEQTLTSEFWRGLEDQGARPLRLVWDTTIVSDTVNADTLYVERMAAAGGVVALSGTALLGLIDHGRPPADVRPDAPLPLPSTQVLRHVKQSGSDLDVVAETVDVVGRKLSDLRGK